GPVAGGVGLRPGPSERGTQYRPGPGALHRLRLRLRRGAARDAALWRRRPASFLRERPALPAPVRVRTMMAPAMVVNRAPVPRAIVKRAIVKQVVAEAAR